MPRSPFEKPTRLAQVLQDVVRRRGLAEQFVGQELELLWKKAAGERVARNSRVKRLRNGTLEVAVKNGAILEELNSYLHNELLAALQSQSPQSEIQSLKFVKVR